MAEERIEVALARGEELFSRGKIDEATAVFQDILNQEPAQCEALNNMGVICHARGDSEEAERYFSRALDANGDNLEALANLADLYNATGKKDREAECLEKIVALRPDDRDATSRLALLYFEIINATDGANRNQPSIHPATSDERKLSLEPSEPEEPRALLAEQTWEEVTIHEVYHAFLKSEFDRCVKSFGQVAAANKGLIDDPDFENESQNSKRALLLFFRAPLLLRIPCSTVWYRVASLQASHFHELLVIGRCGWDDPKDRNELLLVAKRKNEAWDPNRGTRHMPILWGHSREGPFTIIEGNHRLVACASSERKSELTIPVYVGLSDEYCYWHLPDPAR